MYLNLLISYALRANEGDSAYLSKRAVEFWSLAVCLWRKLHKKVAKSAKKNVAGAKKLDYIKNELMALHSVRRGVEGELHVITVG